METKQANTKRLNRRRLNRRDFLRTATLAAGGLMVAACTPSAPAPASDSGDAAGPNEAQIELEFMTWWLPPLVLGTAVEHAVEAYNEDLSGVNVTIQPNPGGTDGQLQKWQTALAGGTAPDVTLMRPHFHTAFASRGAFVQIDDYLAAESDISRENYWPQTIERLSWEGKLWGVAAEIWFSFMFLNLDLFDAADQEAPSPDWTYDDFLEIADSLTQGEGIDKQFGTASLSGWWHQSIWAWGGEVLDETETKCMASESPGPEAIQ